MRIENMKIDARRYDIDWLRNLGILLLFPFHAARVFDYWEVFYVKNSELSWSLSWFIAVSAYWFMPLLFYLAGVSSFYALKKRTESQYIKERFNRLFIPLLFGLLIIVPPQGYIAKLNQNGFNENYFNFLKGYFVDFSDLTGYFGSFTPAHLWFILYLFIFSIVALPIFKYLNKLQRKGLKIIDYLKNPLIMIMLFIPLTLTEALPSPAGKNPFYYFFIFLLGYLMCLHEGTQKTINKCKFRILIFLLLYVPLWLIITSTYSNIEDGSWIAILFAFLRNIAVWLTLIVILGYGKKHLNKKHRILSYMNKAAFPIYVLHQTVLIIVSVYIVRIKGLIYYKFGLIVLLTLVLCILLYEILKRIPITRWLLGIK